MTRKASARQGERYPGLTLRIPGGRTPAMGPGRAELLERIAASGSISAAARGMKMSYRRAWQLVESMNKSFAEPLVVTETGGQRGGGARVTKFGAGVLTRYRRMELKASAAISGEVRRFAVLLKRPRAAS
jgi:molybdate transport system regulatory protein